MNVTRVNPALEKSVERILEAQIFVCTNSLSTIDTFTLARNIVLINETGAMRTCLLFVRMAVRSTKTWFIGTFDLARHPQRFRKK